MKFLTNLTILPSRRALSTVGIVYMLTSSIRIDIISTISVKIKIKMSNLKELEKIRE